MRFLDARPVEFVAPADPTDPKTRWSIRPISFFDVLDIEKEAGKPPVRGTKLYFSLVPPEEPVPKNETKEQEEARLVRRATAFRDAYLALSEEDKAEVDEAKAYLARYNFFVCCRGIIAIDGEKLSRDQVAERLALMTPRSDIPAILAEISNAIGALAQGEAEKKDSSGSPAGSTSTPRA